MKPPNAQSRIGWSFKKECRGSPREKSRHPEDYDGERRHWPKLRIFDKGQRTFGRWLPERPVLVFRIGRQKRTKAEKRRGVVA